MKVKLYSDRSIFIHLEDGDDYEVTSDNGVDIFLSCEQSEVIEKLVRP